MYLATSTGRARSIDKIDPVMQSDSLLLRHSTAIPQAVGSGIYFGKFDRHGPRYLLPGLLFLCLPLGALLANDAANDAAVPPHWLRPAWWALASVGFFVQVVGLSVNVLEDMVRHHYYNARWDYQMSYSPIPGQLALIAKYLHTAPQGIGLGWDRWFVLLSAAGASSVLVIGIEALFVAGAVGFGWLTWHEARRANLISQNSDPIETAR